MTFKINSNCKCRSCGLDWNYGRSCGLGEKNSFSWVVVSILTQYYLDYNTSILTFVLFV